MQIIKFPISSRAQMSTSHVDVENLQIIQKKTLFNATKNCILLQRQAILAL